MKLKNKILSLASCFILFLTQTIKSINSYSYKDDLYIVTNNFISFVVDGTKYTIPLVAIPSTAITIYKSIKEIPRDLYEFLVISKKSINKSFKIIKWLGLVTTVLTSGMLIKGWKQPKIDIESLLAAMYMITIPGTISIVSLIGEKLTNN